MRRTACAFRIALLILLLGGPALEAQGNPLIPQQPRGRGVSPSFNGWYQNPDGTYTLSFGYVNRNTEQVLEIPVGAKNSVSPGPQDQGQPTYFTPGRTFGNFTVQVPSTFTREDRVIWTLEANGERFEIPGGLLGSYDVPALRFPSTDARGVTGAVPPVLVVNAEGAEGRGPVGVWAEPVRARVGEEVPLMVSTWEESAEGYPTGAPVVLRYHHYRGSAVSFAQQTQTLRDGVREGGTTAVFSQPGQYIVIVQVHFAGVSVTDAGHEQCCWTNGYFPVTVAP